MSDRPRARRLADQIQFVVAEMIERRLKDPRFGFVTITDVRMTADLREATVYYTVLGTDEEQDATAAAFASSAGKLRSEVGRVLGIKFTPTLAFQADRVPEHARRIEELLHVAREYDAQRAEVSEGAEYAGDPDPYRAPSDDDEIDEPGAQRS